MTHLEGTLRVSRPQPRAAAPEERIQTAESDALLENVEAALFAEEQAAIRFADPVRGVTLFEKNASQRQELARPIMPMWRKVLRSVRYGMLASMLGYGGFLGYSIWYGPVTGADTASAQVAARYRSETVAEAPVSKQAVQSYNVAASQPKRIQLTGQDIHARIQAQGMTDGAELLAAKNSNDIAWYNGSAMPGRSGVSVMVGALAGPTKPHISRPEAGRDGTV